MSETQPRLSAQSLTVLEMIAAGCTYEQILSAHSEFNYVDIFRAAEEALQLGLGGSRPRRPAYTVAKKRERYPRAYEKWIDKENAELRHLVRSGATVAQIAGQLKRNRGAIRSRIMKLNLVAELAPKEQERLRRIVKRDGDPSKYSNSAARR